MKKKLHIRLHCKRNSLGLWWWAETNLGLTTWLVPSPRRAIYEILER